MLCNKISKNPRKGFLQLLDRGMNKIKKKQYMFEPYVTQAFFRPRSRDVSRKKVHFGPPYCTVYYFTLMTIILLSSNSHMRSQKFWMCISCRTVVMHTSCLPSCLFFFEKRRINSSYSKVSYYSIIFECLHCYQNFSTLWLIPLIFFKTYIHTSMIYWVLKKEYVDMY